MTEVILVDEQDNELGQTSKLAAHQLGQCHRAFSVFIFRKTENDLQLLLQKRAAHKYHCGNLWTNTCCSHPQPGESVLDAGSRRLWEEMGIKTTLQSVGAFHYIAHFDNGLTENEFDHVLVGSVTSPEFQINPDEVAEARWISLTELQQDLLQHPAAYTPWFTRALEIAAQTIEMHNS